MKLSDLREERLASNHRPCPACRARGNHADECELCNGTGNVHWTIDRKHSEKHVHTRDGKQITCAAAGCK